jgi:hypothetical protein
MARLVEAMRGVLDVPRQCEYPRLRVLWRARLWRREQSGNGTAKVAGIFFSADCGETGA